MKMTKTRVKKSIHELMSQSCFTHGSALEFHCNWYVIFFNSLHSVFTKTHNHTTNESKISKVQP